MAIPRRLPSCDVVRLFGSLASLLMLSSVICAQSGSSYLVSTVAGGQTQGLGDGGPALQAQISLSTAFEPRGIAADGFGNFFITDGNRVRKVDNSGIINTIAGTGDYGSVVTAARRRRRSSPVPQGSRLMLLATFTLLINTMAESAKSPRKGFITTVTGNGSISLQDGAPATSTGIGIPISVAVDRGGNLYISVSDHFGGGYGLRIRKVTAAGIISTVAGDGTTVLGFGGYPPLSMGIAVDAFGILYIADPAHENILRDR